MIFHQQLSSATDENLVENIQLYNWSNRFSIVNNIPTVKTEVVYGKGQAWSSYQSHTH